MAGASIIHPTPVDQEFLARHRQGRLLGRMEALGFELRDEATLRSLTQDVVKTSEIEGETLNVEQVRSSIAKRLGMDVGMDVGVEVRVGRDVEGIVEVLVDATGKPFLPLTPERLFGWHAALFPSSHWQRCWPRRASGNPNRANRSMNGKERCSIGCWMDSKAN